MTRSLAWSAVIVVLASVAWQQIKAPGTKREQNRVAIIENAIAARDWDTARSVALAALESHPDERRLHWYLSEIARQDGMPELALLQLSLAAAPPSAGSGRPLYSVPTHNETVAALNSVRNALPESTMAPMEHLRLARIYGQLDDIPACTSALRRAAAHAGSASPTYGSVSRRFLAGAIRVRPDRLAELSDAEIDRALAQLAGTVETQLGAHIAIFAGGSYLHNKHMLVVNGAVHEYAANGNWCCIFVDAEGARGNDSNPSVHSSELSLTPLTGEVERLNQWLDQVPSGTLAVCMASPEAIAQSSNAAIDAWRKLLGLTQIPSPDNAKAYALLLERKQEGIVRLERAAIAPDEPAMLVCTGPSSQ